MADLDLDIITQKQKTVRLFGKDIAFKPLKMKTHLENEARLQELDRLPIDDPEAMVQAEEIIEEYVKTILEVTDEEAGQLTIEQFQALKKYIDRKGMYDQGFSDKEIDQMEKKALKKKIASA